MAEPAIPVLAQTRIVTLASLRRDRLLPMRGEVVATIGSRVDPLDIVGRAPGEGHLRPVPLGRYMQASEGALGRYMRKHPGEEIEPRDIIASRPQWFGMIQRIYRAPGPGRITALQGTWLALELTETPIELRALYRGVIVNVMPRFGITIEATGALVQGIWGDGGEGYGVLKRMVEAPGELLAEDRIDTSVSGTVLLGGAGISESAFRRAAQQHAAGLVIGGAPASIRELAQTLRPPTIITEGFGEYAMAAPIFELLSARHGEETVLNTTTRSSGAPRPEVFIPAVPTEREPLNAQPLAALTAQMHAHVRLLAPPRERAIGRIVDVPKRPRTLESGVSAWGAEVELERGERVFAPWRNLELID